jgi:VCBS repeat-containing protein
MIPRANIVIGGAGINRTVTITPVANSFGTATITITAKDDPAGLLASDSFVLTVTSVNDLPTMTGIENITMNEDASKTLAVTIDDAETPAGSIVLAVVSSDNPALIPVGNVVWSGSGANRNLQITPLANQHGTAVITVKATDADGGETIEDITVTVNSVNDAPSFVMGADIVVIEDSGVYTESNWATSISPGPANESAQTVSFNVSATNTGLFSVAPSLDSTGSLTFTPAANAYGVSIVSVRLQDELGAQTSISTFTIEVTPVNDSPVAIARMLNRIR